MQLQTVMVSKTAQLNKPQYNNQWYAVVVARTVLAACKLQQL
jgi:hypothetical protein